MKFLTTPESSFDNLPDYPFSPNYVEVENGMKMHYVDEGSNNKGLVLCLHGEPSWSYLYRKMIPVFVAAGYRVIAPDLIGFGKSSKPTETSDYTYQKHVDWIKTFISKLGLIDINLFCQDWGGLIGLRILAEESHLFSRTVAGNTFLPTGEREASEAFLKWQKFSQTAPVLPVGKIIQNSTVAKMSDVEVAAYEAPYPNESYKAGAKIFPSLVPTSTDDPESNNNKKAWETLMKLEQPFLTLFSDSDPITKGREKALQKLIPGCKGQAHTIIQAGGHFLQEDKGEEIAGLMVKFMETT
ncbi:MAG: haloalkane dehalogenase [Saprospiraceae bacterium]|nr:haloalkane dehalogenase [Saprospiraceae bacterium]|tara:strand:+ start:3320 stop:4213 length:894 start_codon:yes stop_codon:yes gene_type:complete